MTEPMTVNEYSVSAAINKERASAVRFTRYNPWQLGIYVTGSLAVPVAAAALAVWLVGWLAGVLVALGLVALPVFVILWAVDAWLVEHERLIAERLQLRRAGEAHTPQLASSEPAVQPGRHLRLGFSQNGRIVPPAAAPDPAMDRLRGLCLALVKLGAPAGKWTRSALAEGPDAPMRGDDWDLASVELQDLDLFIVKAGNGGGLRPKPGRELADIIARLEVAR